MRAVTIGILALSCCGCAAPAFDLVARDPEAPWLVGNHWVRTESSRATVNTAFDHAWLDHLIFEVEVVNQSDSTLDVDPQAFSFTLSSSGKDLPKKLRKPFAALGPEAVAARLDKAISHQADLSFIATALMGLAVVAVVAASVVSTGELPELGPTESSAQLAVYDGEPHEPRAPDLRRARRVYESRVLRRTTLAPGESVRGDLWLPTWPVSRAVGPAPSESGDLSITAKPARARSDHALTLRTPDALGGQEIEFSVAPEW